MKLDDVDHGIIRILQKDARTSFTDVAKELGVSDATIHLRSRKLEDAGIIKKYTLVIDRSKIGEFEAYVLLNIAPGKLEAAASELTQIANVHELHEIYGQYEAILKLSGEDVSAIRDLVIKKIRKTSGVTRTEILTIFRTWRNS